MRASANFESSGQDEIVQLSPGEFIGRSDLAALCIDDPRVSEAHAMVSLRGKALKLLALRGRFRVNGKVEAEVELREGLEIELASGLTVKCVDVTLPETLPGLDVQGLPPMLLTGTTTLFGGAPPRVVRGYDPRGDVVLWASGDRWRVSLKNADAREVGVGDSFELCDMSVSLVAIPIEIAGHERTRGVLRTPLVFTLLGQTVRVKREGQPANLISGIPGKILASLVSEGRPMNWKEITARVWPGDQSLEMSLRRRLDAGLSRLRSRLSPFAAPDEELIRLDGAGQVMLVLSDQDHVITQQG